MADVLTSDQLRKAAGHLLTIEQVSDLLKLSPDTLAQWRAKGINIPFIRLGEHKPGKAFRGQVRYRLNDVLSFLDSNVVEVERNNPGNPRGLQKRGAR